jgi:hypothetical protein
MCVTIVANILILFPVGLVIWGISIDQNYHWMVGQVAFFLCMSHPAKMRR